MADRGEVIRGLQIERECVSRDCDRNCGKCDLAQDRDWLLSVYDDALAILKEREPKPVISDRQCETHPGHWERKGFCPKCHQEVLWMVNREYCGFCGQPMKWHD